MSSLSRIGIAWALLATLAPPARAAAPVPLDSRLRFDHLTVEDGLPTNWVMALLKDSYGFVWFGTHQGLARYDGTNLSVYRSDPADPRTLPAPFAGMLFEDREKRLWVGFAWNNAGIARYNRECDCFQRFPVQKDIHDVRAMVQDKSGRLWIGTEDGVALFDPATGAGKVYPLRVPGLTVRMPVVNTLLIDASERMWVGTDGGLYRFDPGHGTYEPWPDAPGDPLGLSRASVWTLVEDPDGSFWVATIGAGLQRAYPDAGRVVRYLPDPEDPHSISSARVRGLARDSEGRIYSGTENGGLNVLDPSTKHFTRYRPNLDDQGSLNSFSTWKLLIDDEGTLWVATHNGGVNWAAAGGPQFHTIEAQRGGLSDPHVSSVLEDRRGHLFIGTDGGGLNELDLRTNQFTVYRHDPKNAFSVGSNSIFAAIEARGGGLWLGGWDAGLGLLDVRTGKVTRFRHDPSDPHSLPSNHVWCIRELSTGEVLVGTQAGTALLDKAHRRFQRLSDIYPKLGNGTTNSTAEDGTGGLWLCGYNFAGESMVAHLDRATGDVVHYRSDHSVPPGPASGVCLAVHVDARKNVWVGTLGALHVLAPGAERFRRWEPDADLSNDEASNVLEDDSGNIWVSMGSKLLRIADAVHLPRDPHIDSFDRRDGFRGPLPFGAAFRSDSGQMFFGGVGGVTSFWPQNMRRNRAAPRVVLTDIKVLNRSLRPCVGSPLTKSVSMTEDLTLSYEDSVITFGFAALNFWLPQKNQYSYKLEGFDRDWSDVGARHEATYTNLSPGDYTFRVRAANNDGVWSEPGASLRLRVTPPFWGTWWFRLTTLAAIVGWAVQIHRRRVWVLKLEARELAAKMEERTRLARELHDTLEQALAGIRLQLSVAARHLRVSPESAATNLDLARRMLAYCIEEARRAVLDLRSRTLEEADLPKALAEQAQRLTGQTPVAVDVRVAGTYRRLDSAVEHHLFRIAQEALTNAIKHSGGHRIDVELTYDDSETTLVVRDDGRGLGAQMAAPGRHFGLQGMRERVERLGGSLTLESPPSGGVRVMVTIPAHSATGQARTA